MTLLPVSFPRKREFSGQRAQPRLSLDSRFRGNDIAGDSIKSRHALGSGEFPAGRFDAMGRSDEA
jgi:hypothetical protein